MGRKKRAETIVAGVRKTVPDTQAVPPNHYLSDVEALYRAGLCAEVLSNTDESKIRSLAPPDSLQALLMREWPSSISVTS